MFLCVLCVFCVCLVIKCKLGYCNYVSFMTSYIVFYYFFITQDVWKVIMIDNIMKSSIDFSHNKRIFVNNKCCFFSFVFLFSACKY